jgi:hypothetical protein
MSDKTFANVQLLCGFNGADGATAFTDESTAARTATFVGNAQLDTAQARFGSASLLLDGTGDYVTFADAPAFTLGTSDFTLDAWVRFNTTPGAGSFAIMSHYNASGNQRAWVLAYVSGTLSLAYSTNGTSNTNVTGTWSAADATWYHVAAARIGADLRIFIDGELIATDNIAASSIFNSTSALQIGSQSLGVNPFNGWIQEARFKVGVGEYAASFRRPQGPFNRRKNTGLLGDYFQPTVFMA